MKVTIEEQKLYDDFTASVFQRGYEKGKEDATISYQNAYNEGNVDGYSRGYDEGVKDGQKGKISEMLVDTYTQGLNDAWKCARKIMLCEAKGGLSIGEHVEIFSDIEPAEILKNYTASEVIAKIKEYEEKQKAPNIARACSILDDICPYDIPCAECEVHCSVERAKQKLKGDKE